MISDYELPLLLHIAFVTVWLGGGAMLQLLMVRARRADDPSRVATLGQEIEWVGLHILTPASLLVLATGFWLMSKDVFHFDETWVKLGLAGYALTFLTGLLFLGPQSGKIGKLAAEKGPADPEVVSLSNRLLLVARLDLLLLYLILFDMVIKPT